MPTASPFKLKSETADQGPPRKIGVGFDRTRSSRSAAVWLANSCEDFAVCGADFDGSLSRFTLPSDGPLLRPMCLLLAPRRPWMADCIQPPVHAATARQWLLPMVFEADGHLLGTRPHT